MVDLNMEKLGLPWEGPFEVEDLLSGAIYSWLGQRNYIALRPAVMPAHIFRIVREPTS
jgi:starch synthase (maltosyl-transferring)